MLWFVLIKYSACVWCGWCSLKGIEVWFTNQSYNPIFFLNTAINLYSLNLVAGLKCFPLGAQRPLKLLSRPEQISTVQVWGKWYWKCRDTWKPLWFKKYLNFGSVKTKFCFLPREIRKGSFYSSFLIPPPSNLFLDFFMYRIHQKWRITVSSHFSALSLLRCAEAIVGA